MLTLQKPQTTCRQCPAWQPSDRTPNVGICSRDGDRSTCYGVFCIGQCPIWQPSPRTQNVGRCPLYDERTFGHDIAGHNCPKPLNTYKVDLFQDGEWVKEVTIKAASIKAVNAAILKLGDFASNQPRLCRA